MTKSLNELDTMLDELDRDLQMLIMNNADHDDLWAVFAAQADAIEASAAAGDLQHVRARTSNILASQGIVPSGYADELSD